MSLRISIPNYTQIECDVYDANHKYLQDNTILPIKEAIARFRSAARFWKFDSAVYAAVEHIELKLKAFIPGSVMPPQFPNKPVEWPYSSEGEGQDQGHLDPYEGKWQKGWGR